MGNDNIAIRLVNVTRSFQEGRKTHVVLDGVDLEVDRGELVALRGRSGSGKSTLLNLVAGIDIPDSGSVDVAGRDIARLSERDRTLFRRRHIGFVYQAFNLVPTLPVADNLRLVLELNGVDTKSADARIESLLGAVGLAERATSYPDVLSGGEQQRIAIARALCHEPDVLLADEPTGNLDDENAHTVLALLEELVRAGNRTMLVATHSNEVARRCDRIIELHNGRLTTIGHPNPEQN